MSQDMQQQLDGIKAEIKASESRLGLRLDKVETRLDRVETTLRQVVITVSGHTEAISRIEQRLTKLDTKLDVFGEWMKRGDALMAEVLASRAERVLSDKSFRDQQSTLTDHELRITRLERRKPS
jgi:septation ring formation regulator EzrA